MTTKPDIRNFPILPPVSIHSYERYLPTAFDESMSILQKINKVIHQLNQIGEVSNGLVRQWNDLIEWVVGNGLTEIINAEIDRLIVDGTFDILIYKIVGNLTLLETLDKSDMVNALNEVNRIAVENDLEIGDITSLITDDKTNLVTAINELKLVTDINRQSPITIGEATGHGTISGLKVTQQNVLAMAVEIGNATDPNIVHLPSGARYTINTMAIPVNPSHSTLNRRDIVFVNDRGIVSYLDGIPSATPVAPNLPLGSVLLAEIIVQANDTTINDTDIIDKRDLKNLSQLLTNNKSNLVQAINEIITSLNDVINNAVGDVAKLPTNDKTSIVNAIIEVMDESATKLDVGDKNNLPTTDKTSIVNAIIEIVSSLNKVINDAVGDVSNLPTTDKTSIVNAIIEVVNESATKVDVGDKNNLVTTDKTTIVGAINEVNQKNKTTNDNLLLIGEEFTKTKNKTDHIISLEDYPRIAPETNDNGRMQRAFNNAVRKTVLIPPKSYTITVPINVKEGTSIIGSGYNSIIECFTTDGFNFETSNVIAPISISGFHMHGNACENNTAITVKGTSNQLERTTGLVFTGIYIAFFGKGFSARGMWHSDITTCTFNHVYTGIELIGQCVKINVTNNRILKGGLIPGTGYSKGVLIDSSFDYGVGRNEERRPEDVTIWNNIIFGFDIGIDWQRCLYGKIQNNDLDYCYYKGIQFGQSDGGLSIADNWITLDGTASLYGIHAQNLGYVPTLTHTTIEHNTIRHNSVTPNVDGVGIFLGNNQDNVDIEKNEIIGYKNADIHTSNGKNISITKNKCKTVGGTSISIVSNRGGVSFDKNLIASKIYVHPNSNEKISIGETLGDVQSTLVEGKTTILSGQTSGVTTFAELGKPNFMYNASSVLAPQLQLFLPSANLGVVWGTVDTDTVVINCTEPAIDDIVIRWVAKSVQANH